MQILRFGIESNFAKLLFEDPQPVYGSLNCNFVKLLSIPNRISYILTDYCTPGCRVNFNLSWLKW